jgi:hypothetical protein
MPIYYYGTGSNESGIHSETEFMTIMNETFVQRDWTQDRYTEWLQTIKEAYPNRNLPEEFKNFSLEDWIDFSGATREFYVSPDINLREEVDYSDAFD